MPESRTRPGHHPHQKEGLVPASQRTRGRTLWAILLAVFAAAIAFFAAGDNYIILIVAAIAGAFVGYLIGWKMEKDTSHK